MTLLILGLLLWILPHWMKRLAPNLRATMGDQKAKLFVSVTSFAGIGLMILGYQGAAVVDLWNPPAFMRHINNLLMLIAVFCFAISLSKGALRAKIRHPMLGGVKAWATAHLLVNGDLASIVLFGGMLVWAIVSVITINRSGPWANRPAAGPVRNDIIAFGISIIVMGGIGYIHGLIGPAAFGG